MRWIYLEGTSAIRRGMNEGEKKMKEKIENAVLRSLMNFEKDFEREKDFEMNLSGWDISQTFQARKRKVIPYHRGRTIGKYMLGAG